MLQGCNTEAAWIKGCMLHIQTALARNEELVFKQNLQMSKCLNSKTEYMSKTIMYVLLLHITRKSHLFYAFVVPFITLFGLTAANPCPFQHSKTQIEPNQTVTCSDFGNLTAGSALHLCSRRFTFDLHRFQLQGSLTMKQYAIWIITHVAGTL